MKKMIYFLCLTLFLFPMAGCYTMNHTIGSADPNGPVVAKDTQWFLLWGLIPLNNVDGGQLAKSKGLTNNYTIQTQQSVLDVVLNIITGFVTVYSRTVAVIGGNGSAAVVGGGVNTLQMANQAMMSKDYNTAMQDYQAAINANPNSAAAYQGLGTCYYYMGQKDQAINAYEKAVALDPSDTRLQAFIQKLKGQ